MLFAPSLASRKLEKGRTAIMETKPLDALGRSKPLTINRLNAKQMYLATEYVKTHYTASGLFDDKFAAAASEALGFTVSESSIVTARETLELPSNRAVAQAAKVGTSDAGVAELAKRTLRLAELVHSLVDRLVVLETHQRVLIAFAQRSGPVEGLEGLQFHLGRPNGKAGGA